MDVDSDPGSESEHDPREDVPSPAESSHDEFEDAAPKKKPSKSAMKGAGSKKKKNVQIRKDDETQNLLYETLTEATVDLPTAIQEWLTTFVDDRREALQILVNCLIRVGSSLHSYASSNLISEHGLPTRHYIRSGSRL